MNEQNFWDLIEDAHAQSAGEMDSKCQAVKEAISQLSKEEALIFAGYFDEMMDKAYSWSLWGAAYVIDGGCGDDSFSDFRASLVSRGKDSFAKALENPDSLAEETYDEDLWFYEGFQYDITESIKEVLGTYSKRSQPHPKEPSGEPWEDEPEELKAKYPKLWAKFEYVWTLSETLTTKEEKKPWWKFW